MFQTYHFIFKITQKYKNKLYDAFRKIYTDIQQGRYSACQYWFEDEKNKKFYEDVYYEMDALADIEFFTEFENYFYGDEEDEVDLDPNVKTVRDIIASNALMKAVNEV